QWLTADPHDFAHFMSRAAAVATNFFHGCIFCLLHLKSFVCEATDYRSNKIRDLLKLVGGERHIMSGEHSSADFVGALTDPIDAVVPQNIAALRTASDQY